MDLDLTAAYDFDLPPTQIAADPPAVRGQSRLLVVPRQGALRDAEFADVGDLLRPGDLLVVNDARVVPARLHATRSHGGRVEVFGLGFGAEGQWEAPRPGEALELIALTRSSKRLRSGEVLLTARTGVEVEVIEPIGDRGPARLRLPLGVDPWALLDREGELALPPYIVRQRRDAGRPDVDAADATRYQTVYAARRGAVAAPTAGLHFTEALLSDLAARGVELARLTLLVGVGTFRPVQSERLSGHTMHTEHYEIPEATAAMIARTRSRGGRVVAVGTTVVRTLEAAWNGTTVPSGPGSTAICIAPGHRWAVTDALITNFHLPRSTLLALVSALGGWTRVMGAYRHAVAAGYRFFSYGDAMWVERE